MFTTIVLEIEHTKPMPLAEMVAGRAWSIDGVVSVELRDPPQDSSKDKDGFTKRELSLGAGEVVSG